MSFSLAFIYFCRRVSLSGVELLFQPHRPVHQPTQPAAGGAWPCKEKESPWQVRSFCVFIMCIFSVDYFSDLPLLFSLYHFFFSRYGDMRVVMAYELFSMWQKLGASSPSPPQHIVHTLPWSTCNIFLKSYNQRCLSVWLCVIQETTSPTSSQEWWVPFWVSRWCLRMKFEISWSQFFTTWWTGSRGKMATSNRSL